MKLNNIFFLFFEIVQIAGISTFLINSKAIHRHIALSNIFYKLLHWKIIKERVLTKMSSYKKHIVSDRYSLNGRFCLRISTCLRTRFLIIIPLFRADKNWRVDPMNSPSVVEQKIFQFWKISFKWLAVYILRCWNIYNQGIGSLPYR